MSQPIHTVLIVDDCPEDCERYQRYLRQAKTHTYTCLEAASGQAGLALWQQHQPDLILLNDQLPDLDGLAWLTQLSSQTASSPLPVILVMEQGNEAIAVQALRAGAQDYLVKGQITPERLQLTVQATLERLQLQTQLAARTAELSQLTQNWQQNLEKLHRSEAQYRSLFESIDEGFCIIEVLFDQQQKPVDFRYLEVNPAFERLTTIPNAVGRRMRDIAPQHEDYWFENFGKVALTGEAMRFENYAAELQRWYEVFAFAVADPRLHQVGILFTDTSDRNRAEAERDQTQTLLQHREQVYKALVENSPDMIERFDVQLRHLYVSPSLERVSGFPAAHFLGKTCREMGLPVSMVNPWEAAVDTLLATGQPQTIEFETMTASGRRWFEMRLAPELTAAGKIASFVCISRDISDRKQGEIQLREMSDALSNAVEGISRLDPQGHYLFVNEAYAKAVGYTPTEMIGMNWQITVHPDDLEAVTAQYQHMLNTGKVELEARGIRKDGSVFHKQLFMVSAYDDEHSFIGHHCFMKDITEKKQLEAQFLRTQRLESIGTLASGIAHDLNNILTPVLAVAHLLPRKLAPVDPTLQPLLELLEGSAKRGRDLVQQVLSFARGQDEQRHILQVGYLLSEMGKIAHQTFPQSIQVQTQISTRDLWLMSADTTQLHQVLMNLCVNARDAMPDGGTLTIAAENCAIDETLAHMHLDAHVGAYVKITIADTGTGITPAVYDRIFDPFFTTKAQGQGTGLGLSTVRTIVKNHGGFIAIETAPGQGTSFQVYLPALPPTQDPTRPPSPETALPEPHSGNGELVLVVDDEAAIRQTIQVVLETHGFRVFVAPDGLAAIALYTQHQSAIDLVLMDVMMPTMDGFKLIETLAKFRPPVPIIAMSGVAAHRDRILRYAQVQAFVAKPFTAEALLAAIRTVPTANSVKTLVDQTRT